MISNWNIIYISFWFEDDDKFMKLHVINFPKINLGLVVRFT